MSARWTCIYGGGVIAARCRSDSPLPTRTRQERHGTVGDKRNLQNDLRGTYARSWTVSVDQNGKRIVHVHYHEKPQTKKMTVES